MHEFSIVETMLTQVRAVADEHGMTGISRVEVEAGELRQVIPDILTFAFAQCVAGTDLDGAELIVTECQARARCRNCGRTYRPQLNDFRCPGCAVANAEILEGDHIILKSITAREHAPQDSMS